MATRKRIYALGAALALAVAATAIQAATVQRLRVPGGTSEIAIGERVLVVEAEDDVALLLSVDGDLVTGVLEKVSANGPAVSVRITWRISKLTVVVGEVDAPLEFMTSLRKETGHGEM